MMARYVDQYVWLRSDGCVVGVNLEYLNQKIDYYNSSSYLVSQNCFWEWLSWEEGQNFYGYSVLWKSKLDSKVHIIKRGGIR